MSSAPRSEPANPREQAFLREAIDDPSWLLQEIDILGNRAGFLRMPEASYRESPFLDYRMKAPASQPVITRLSSLVDAAQDANARPISWIFHLGHVGSTLLTRLLGELDELLPLSEPLPLRALAGVTRQLDDPLALLGPEDCKRLEHAALRILSRSFRPDQRALVKATSDCCNLMGRVLRAQPEARAIWLDVDLETFLAGMLRNDLRRSETRDHGQSRLRDLHDLTGDRSIHFHELDIARLTAVSWLANQGHWLVDGKPSSRVLRVHFHDLLESPEETLRRILGHLDLAAGPERVERLANSQWYKRYSKDSATAFGIEERFAQLKVSREENAAEIQEGLEFAAELCERHEALKPLSAYFRR